MSYDLAVWEGAPPATDAEAMAFYEQLMDQMEEDSQKQPPSPRIQAYVSALLQRWPDITDDDNDSPWASGPLLSEAFGRAIYFPMVWSRAEEASEFAAKTAHEHGLVCFDPQMGQLRPKSASGRRPTLLRRLLRGGA